MSILSEENGYRRCLFLHSNLTIDMENRNQLPPLLLVFLTSDLIEAGLVEDAGEELQTDDGVDDDDKHDQQHDVEEGNEGHQDGVEHNLQTWRRKSQDIRPSL